VVFKVYQVLMALLELKVMPTSFKQMTACAYGIQLHLLG